MQAIILAGGQGTRLRPLTYTIPKPMLPIGNRPALAHTLEALGEAGCHDAIITTNYLADVVTENICDHQWPMPVRCIKEEEPLGTAGCVQNVIDLMDEEFLVIPGDAVADFNYRSFIQFHRDKDADVTIAVMEVDDTREFGIVALNEDGRIERFQEKPRPEEAFSNLANAAFYVVKRRVFDNVPRGEPFDFSNQLFPLLMQQGARFFAWQKRGFWVDIGRVHNYLRGNQYIIRGRADIAPDAIIAPTATLVPPFLIGSRVTIGDHCVIGPNSIIGDHCSIGANTYISGSVILSRVTIGKGARLNDCVVASRTRLRDGVSVGAMAVIGEGCEIGVGTQVGAHSRVGPVTAVPAGTVVEGVVAPRIEKIEGLQEKVSHGPMASQLEKLSPEQHDVYALVSEFGEMTAPQIAQASSLPLTVAISVLESLDARGIVLSTADVPRRYALTREEQRISRKILFVDDVEDTRNFFRLVFNMQGHATRLATNGREAIEAFEEEAFDAVIMDVEMPEMDGWEAVRHIREQDNGRTVPILMFTAHAEDDMEAKARAAGADAIFAKPMLPQELLTHLSEYL